MLSLPLLYYNVFFNIFCFPFKVLSKSLIICFWDINTRFKGGSLNSPGPQFMADKQLPTQPKTFLAPNLK